jgi:nucleotide-binding universal stress UspA family protein
MPNFCKGDAMYRSIMVPLDGSTFSEHALPIALTIASQHAATVQLAHVHTPPNIPRYVGEQLAFDMLDEQMRESEQAYLEGLAQRLSSHWNVGISAVLLDGAAVAETLHNYTVATGIDLMVMTTHARGGLVRFWLGSVADALARSAVLPTLLVRPPEEASGGLELDRQHIFRHILIPLDGSTLAEQALDHALALGTPGQTAYTLLQAIDPLVAEHTHPPYSVGLDRAVFEQLREESQRYLDRIATRFGPDHTRVQTQLVVARPSDAILDYAREHAVDLVAMAAHSHSQISRFFLGSVADKVVRGAQVPVLLYHPAGNPANDDRGDA